MTCDSGQTTVVGLTLTDNNLVGTIPPTLRNLTNAECIVLDYNQISGIIPMEIGGHTMEGPR